MGKRVKAIRMSKTASVKVVDPKGKEVWAACSSCGKETAHKVLVDVEEHDATPDGDMQVWNSYHVVQCGGCKTVSFCEESRCTEDLEWDEQGKAVLSVTQKLFPGRLAGRPLLDDIYDLPHGVARIYRQTHEALCGKLSILAGMGLRAILEAVCSERKAEGKSLYDRIQTLANQGVVTREGANILHSIRLLGNKAAHETKANTEEELFAAFDVIEHLLKAVYIIPRKARKLGSRP